MLAELSGDIFCANSSYRTGLIATSILESNLVGIAHCVGYKLLEEVLMGRFLRRGHEDLPIPYLD
jgi:hypothetical protein